MAVVNPLSKEHAAADVQAVYDNLRQAFGLWGQNIGTHYFRQVYSPL